MMRYGFLLVAASFIHIALGHMGIYGVWLNGEFQGDGRNVYIRTPVSKINSPVRNPDWTYIACNTLGHRVQPKWLEVEAGDTLAPEWYWDNRGDFKAGNHKGPLLVYIAPAGSTNPNTPDLWTKLYHYAYNASDGSWSDDYFQQDAIRTKGHHYITIPDVPAGDYLIRSEVIGLQEAQYDNGAQHFSSCVQIRVKSSGSALLPSGVSFPGSYIPLQPGLKWDLWNNDPSKCPLPGGPVWEGSPGGGIFKSATLTQSSLYKRYRGHVVV